MPAAFAAQEVWCPLLTPFQHDGRVDEDRFAAFAREIMAAGATGLVPFGSTGEGPSLDGRERVRLLQRLLETGIPPERLIVGTSTPSLPATADMTARLRRLGVSQFLVMPPFYFPEADSDGIVAYYTGLLETLNEPEVAIYIYHFPKMSKLDTPPEAVAELRRRFGGAIAGIKDSGGDLGRSQAYLSACKNLRLLTGSEAGFLSQARIGGCGVISATANLNTAGIAELATEAQQGDAERRQARVAAVRRAAESVDFVRGLKAVKAHLDNDPAWARPRPPLSPLPRQGAESLVQALAEAGYVPAAAEARV